MFLTIVDAFHVLNILLMPLGGHVVPAGLCQDKFVKDGEDEAVEKDGVEEDHQSGGLVAHDEADERKNYLLKDRQLAVLSLLLLLAEVREGVQLSFVTFLISVFHRDGDFSPTVASTTSLKESYFLVKFEVVCLKVSHLAREDTQLLLLF